MAYTYGTSPVHKYPTPLDDTPLDAVSWAKLVDALGIAVPYVCASQTEQTEYLAAVTAAGLGPSSRQIVRVCRTDLDGLVMRHDGTGWIRDMSGKLARSAYAEAAATDSAGTRRSIGAVSFTLPCAAQLEVVADLLYIPPSSGAWGFQMYLQDGTGRQLSTPRRYSNVSTAQSVVSVREVVDMPAGAGVIHLYTYVEPTSLAIRLGNVGISANYA